MYPRKSKTPAEIIRLNAQGWYVEKIAAHVTWTAQTVTEVLHKWEKLGLEGLWERPRRGGKAKWKEENLVFLEECLRTEPHTYNSHQLTEKLEQERSIKLSPDRFRRVLKKRRSIGSGPGRATQQNKTRKYLDESGFCLWSEPSYTYYFRGKQKRLEQTFASGRRLTIIGFLQQQISFVYGKRDWRCEPQVLYSHDKARSRRCRKNRTD